MREPWNFVGSFNARGRALRLPEGQQALRGKLAVLLERVTFDPASRKIGWVYRIGAKLASPRRAERIPALRTTRRISM